MACVINTQQSSNTFLSSYDHSVDIKKWLLKSIVKKCSCLYWKCFYITDPTFFRTLYKPYQKWIWAAVTLANDEDELSNGCYSSFPITHGQGWRRLLCSSLQGPYSQNCRKICNLWLSLQIEMVSFLLSFCNQGLKNCQKQTVSFFTIKTSW